MQGVSTRIRQEERAKHGCSCKVCKLSACRAQAGQVHACVQAVFAGFKCTRKTRVCAKGQQLFAGGRALDPKSLSYPTCCPCSILLPVSDSFCRTGVQCGRPGHHFPGRDSDATTGPRVHGVKWEAGKGHPGCLAWEGVLSARGGFLYFDDNFPCSWLSGSWLAAPPPQSCSKDLTPQLFSEENTRLPSYVFPFPVFVFASKSPHHPVW